MKRLIEKTVFCGFVTCCRRAGVPTSRWPSFENATIDGVVRPPSEFGMTVGSPPSRTAMHELVVPRSMPMVLAMELLPSQTVDLEFRRPGRRGGDGCPGLGGCAAARPRNKSEPQYGKS